MSMHDPISDMLTRIRNGQMRSKVNVRGVNDGNGGAAGAWDGDGMAMSFFMKSLIVPKDEF